MDSHVKLAHLFMIVVVVGCLSPKSLQAQESSRSWRNLFSRRKSDTQFPPPLTTAARPDSQRVSVDLPAGASGPYRFDSLATDAASVSPSDYFAPHDEVATAAPQKELEAAKIIARVGDQVILAGDLLGQVNQFLHTRMQSIPPEQRSQITEDVLDEQRDQVMRQMLPQVISSKLVYLDFLSSIPKDKIPEIQDNLYQAFDEKQLPVVIERANVQTAADLDRLLRSFGSSLAQQRRSFAEQVAAAQWRTRNAKSAKEVSHDDLLTYYREHADEFQINAKARWEQLTARFDNHATEADAWQAISSMGNEVIHGAPLSAVAKRDSQGPTAHEGGVYDWTTKGSLRSETLDEAIFSLPIDRLSLRMRDEDGFHIVRVIERQDDSMVPFAKAQREIKEKIQRERTEAALAEYVAKLREETPVWTVYD